MSEEEWNLRQAEANREFAALSIATGETIPEVEAQFPQFANTDFIELEAFRRACAELGWMGRRGDLNAFLQKPIWRRGAEHEVWRPTSESGAVLKATYGNRFGHLPWKGQATPLQYIARLHFCNEVFDDCIELASVDGGETSPVRVLTLQPYVTGEETPQDEVDAYLESLGFQCQIIGDDNYKVWHMPWGAHTVYIGDLHPKNVLKTAAGKLVVIDGIVAVV